MSENKTDLDLSWVEFSEVDPTDKCEYLDNTCTKDATWIYTWILPCTCTNHDHFACDEHADLTEKYLPLLLTSMGCSYCGALIDGFTRRRK